jgi:predicted phosphoribosyltransferase
MLFENRAEAGKQLAAAPQYLRGPDTIVLAVPRGGVIVGYEVARALGAPLDVYIARKLTAPGNEELAIGAVASDGTLVLDPDLTRQLGVNQRYIQAEIERQRAEILRCLSSGVRRSFLLMMAWPQAQRPWLRCGRCASNNPPCSHLPCRSARPMS